MKSMISRTLRAVGLSAILVLSQANAAETPARIGRSLAACRALIEDDKRLACFDRNIATATECPNQISIAIQPAPAEIGSRPATYSAESRFGISEANRLRGEAAKAAPKPALSKLVARVAIAQRQGNGTWRLTLENGQVWYQILPSESIDAPVGSEVTITPGWLGSFLMVDASGHSARIHRAK